MVKSLRSLSRRFQAAQLQVAEGGQPATLTFDKDDEDSLDFVTASANLRSLVFGIEPKSKFETKRELQMAPKSTEYATTHADIPGRDGRKHHPGHRNDQCDGRKPVCAAGCAADTQGV